MILTVTLNLALDVTYHVARFQRGKTSRIQTFARQAGGKGVNTARVLHALERDVAVTGLVGGHIGRAARAELAASGIRDELVEIQDESRLTVVVVEADGEATGFSEPGASVTAAEWRSFVTHFTTLIDEVEAVVLSGSVPRQLRADCYAELLEVAEKAGTLTLLDADGEALLQGVRARPDIVKINKAELTGALHGTDVIDGAQALQRAGAHAVVISAGADGLTAVTDDRILHAPPPERLMGNPTGAGDAASAALVAARLQGDSWPDALADAAALSAASVCAPLAGHFDVDVYRDFRTRIKVRIRASGTG